MGQGKIIYVLMMSTTHQKNFSSVKNMGCLSLYFLLPSVIDSGESSFQYFENK
jgi:hypothetical protein